MQVQDVQAFSVQPFLTALDGTDDCTFQVIKVTMDKVDLGTDDRRCSEGLERLSQINFRVAAAVCRRRVEDINPPLQRAADDSALFALAAADHEPRSPATAE